MSHQEDRWQQHYWNLSEKRKAEADRDYAAARQQFFNDEQREQEGRERLRAYQAELSLALRSFAARAPTGAPESTN
jgi:hypothetical protein